jgi:hypothetical protein
MIVNVSCKASFKQSLSLLSKRVSSLALLPPSVRSNLLAGRACTNAHFDPVGKPTAILTGLTSELRPQLSRCSEPFSGFCQPPTTPVAARKRTTSAVSGGHSMPPPLAAVLPGGGRLLSIQSHTVSVRRQPFSYELRIKCVKCMLRFEWAWCLFFSTSSNLASNDDKNGSGSNLISYAL